MSETTVRAGLDVLLADAHRAVDALQAAELSRCSDDEVVSALRVFEALRRRLESVDHVLILDLEQRGVPGADAGPGSRAVVAAGVGCRCR